MSGLDVLVSSGGNIIDGGDAHVDVVATNAQFGASDDIGQVSGSGNGLLETTVTTIVSGSDNIYIEESDDLVIGSVAANEIDVNRVNINNTTTNQASAAQSGVTANFDAIIRAGNNLTVSNAFAASTGQALLHAQGGNLAINNTINAGTNASLLASANITQAAAGDATVGGSLDVHAQGGDINMTDGAVSDVTGNIQYLATGDIYVAQIDSAANVRIEAGGSIIDNGETDVDVIATNLQLVATDVASVVGTG